MNHSSTAANAVHVSQVDITHLLHTRPTRNADYKLENMELAKLAGVLAEHPEEIAQELVGAAMRLTGAHSAGLSLEENFQEQHIFRWIATTGDFSRYADGTMPRSFSPCGEVLDRNDVILMRSPIRCYPYMDKLHKPCEEVLLVPFHYEGRPIGTVWVVSHDSNKEFDSEDLRVTSSITKFAAAAVQTVGFVKSLKDVNEHNEVTMAGLETNDKRKDNFLAMLAHEMRTPLSAINMGVQVLKMTRHSVNFDNTPTLQSIQRQTEQLMSLINDMTDISSIKTGKFAMRTERLLAQDLSARAVEACIAQIQLRQQDLQVEVPELPIVLEGDKMRLTQVLINLLNNANKYTPEKGAIKLTVHADKNTVAFSVIDTGVGIPEQVLPRIFDMFMQEDVSDRKSYSGLGIGLSLVQQFVQMHKGVVTAYSAGENRGSEFKVTLPRINNEFSR